MCVLCCSRKPKGVENMSDKYKEAKYDERQTAVRGRAFKWGYATLLVALLAYSVTDGIWDWCVPFAGCAIAPFAWISILGEAYWWTRASRLGQYVTMALLGLLNLGLAAADAAEGRLVEDGVLQIGGANLALGSVFIFVFIVSFIQGRRAKRGGEE